MYRTQKNFADLEESSDKWSISGATVFGRTNDNQDGLNTKKPCSSCSQSKNAAGMGDLSTVLSTGDITQLFVDPTTGGFDWTTAAILGGAAVGLFLLFGKGKGLGKLSLGNLFGNSARDEAKAAARRAYQSQVRAIDKEFN